MSFELHLVLHVTSAEGGTPAATLDLLDERFVGIPVEALTRTGDSVAFTVPYLGARFAGKLVEGEPRRLDGHWFPGTGRIPALFESVDEVRYPARPQEPAGELPYRTIDVAFGHLPARGLDASFLPVGIDAEDAVSLAGTLSLPRGEGPSPAVVLVAGSGYQDRDATIRGHRPFLVLADRLTRRGVAVLRYDKRGCGVSGGSLRGATSADLAVDVRAALRYLRTRDEVDHARIGLIGHSEGGVLAAMVAAGHDSHLPAFVVALGPLGVSGAEAIPDQMRRISVAHGLPADDVEVVADLQRRLLELTLTIDDQERRGVDMESAARRAWEALSDAGRRGVGGAADNLVAWARRANDPWVRFIADHDPAADFAGVTCPILVLFGGKDLQVAPALHLPPIRAALARADNDDRTIEVLPGLNHLFQSCVRGTPSEYFDLEETLAPAALERIEAWLRARFAK